MDDIDRCLAANVSTQIHQYDKVHPLLEIVARKIAALQPWVFDETKARIYEGLLFSYRDAMARLAMAESRKEDALAVEHTILTNPKNVASTRSIEEHRTMALGLWRDLGRSEDAFQAWLLRGIDTALRKANLTNKVAEACFGPCRSWIEDPKAVSSA